MSTPMHIRRHGGNTEKSLASIPTGRATRKSLAILRDPEKNATLCHVGSGRGSTGTALPTAHAVTPSAR